MDYLTIIALDKHLTITAGGTVLGKTAGALELKEGSYPAVLYVPRRDIDMTLLTKTDRQTTCPHKGGCTYYAVNSAQGLLENAAWSYETPIPGAQQIAGYLAFYPEQVTLA